MKLKDFLKLVQNRTRVTISVYYMKEYDPIVEREARGDLDEKLIEMYKDYRVQRVDVSENVMYLVIEEIGDDNDEHKRF